MSNTTDERQRDLVGVPGPESAQPDVHTDELMVEPGSFRDRNGRISYRDGHVFRGVSDQSLRDWESLSATRFFQHAAASDRIIPTWRLSDSERERLSELQEWAGVLEHEQIPFVSYPYEWSFGMLKDAALLHLELLLAALDEDMTMKDGSAYNVQWRGSSPVFIDIPSFEVMRDGEPWVGYRQFCQLFLYPMLLQANLGVSFQPWLRGSLDGISVEDAAKLLSVRHVLRPGIFKHVYLQSKMQARFASSTTNVQNELQQARFGKELVRNNVRNLIKVINRLNWRRSKSEWSDYAHDNSYTEPDAERKERFVRRAAESRRRRLVWDLGSNTGTFSRIAAESADYVIAMDIDQLAVERMYQSVKSQGPNNILPLCVNLADPSPALGWRLRERKTLVERAKPDLTLCLALIHHMVISANVPLSEFIDWLVTLESDLVIEFVTRDDPMVKRLLTNRDDQYDDYDLANFEAELERRFQVHEREWLDSGTRILYFARPLAS